AYGYLSRTSPLGFEQRLDAYGRALAAALESDATSVPQEVDIAFRQIADHEQARWQQDPRTLQRAEMSARLLRWLVQIKREGMPRFASLAEACRWHAVDGGFVDWARYTIQAGESASDLDDAYGRL